MELSLSKGLLGSRTAVSLKDMINIEVCCKAVLLSY